MRNRWLIALSAIGIHICIGSVYAWSVLTRPIMAQLGFSLAETTWAFSLAILFLGFSAGFLGKYVERYGPRRSGLVSMCFFGAGMLGTALALSLGSLPLLYLFYGVIGGIGLGVGWSTLVAAELVAATQGLGFMVQSAAQFLVTDVVVLGILVIALVAFALELGLRTLQRKMRRMTTASENLKGK